MAAIRSSMEMLQNIIANWISSAQLKVTPEVLLSKSAEFSAKLNKMRQDFDSMDSRVADTCAYWMGDANDIFREKYQEYKPEIEEIIRRLEEHVRDLNAMAGVYSEAETEVKSIIEDLPADVIV